MIDSKMQRVYQLDGNSSSLEKYKIKEEVEVLRIYGLQSIKLISPFIRKLEF